MTISNEYVVNVAIETDEPVTVEALESVAEMGGYASGNIGGRRIETTVTENAPTIERAVAMATFAVIERSSGEVVAVDATTVAEADSG